MRAIVAAAGLLASCAGAPASTASPLAPPPPDVLPLAEVEWQALNPARGDASPRAANLWGDRTEDVATGFLARFVDGFSSPPHIHNVTYRAVVIEGLIHNDDPGAAALWMPPGSFWTQPRGEAHITSARGASMAYVEIDSGPYLVRPADQAFSTDEFPLNVHAANLVWLAEEEGGPAVAHLWRDGERRGVFARVPARAAATIRGRSSLRAVVVRGRPVVGAPLAPGSAIRAATGSFTLSCPEETDCVLYAVADGPVEVARTP